jgi:hypothetical protein
VAPVQKFDGHPCGCSPSTALAEFLRRRPDVRALFKNIRLDVTVKGSKKGKNGQEGQKGAFLPFLPVFAFFASRQFSLRRTSISKVF